MANSRPDLVPLNESFGSDKKKNDYISPKIKSLLETLGMFSLFSDPLSLNQHTEQPLKIWDQYENKKSQTKRKVAGRILS